MKPFLSIFVLTIGLCVASPIWAAPINAEAESIGLTEQTLKMGGPMPAEQLAVSFDHLDLNIKVFPYEKRIEANATLTLGVKEPIRNVVLDLYPNFYVSEIRIDGQRLAESDWSNPDGQLNIELSSVVKAGKTLVVNVAYAGFPHIAARPPWEGGMVWSQTSDGTPWIGSSHWGGGCDLLWPCIDHPTGKPAMADLHITVPKPLVAPANGVLVGVTEKDGWRTYNWKARSPHTYGVVLNIGPYKVLKDEYLSQYGNEIPMEFWYLPDNEERAKILFEEFPKILDFFETQIGPYPWADQKMGVVETPYKGMEHQTINAYGNDFAKTAYGFDNLLQHEFSHEYFANQLSVSNYDDLWLHEGFASYMQPLYGQYLNGDMDYYAMLKATRSGIQNKQPLVTGKERSEKEVYLDEGGPKGDIYSKGSLILHTLRNIIGDEDFFESVRILAYGRPDPKPGNFEPQFRTTKDYERIVNEVTGDDYSWFFAAYFYQAELPTIEQQTNKDLLTLEWSLPDSLPFPMPLEVQVGDRMTTLDMRSGQATIEVPPGTHVVLDPHSKILRQSDAVDLYQEWKETQKKEAQN